MTAHTSGPSLLPEPTTSTSEPAATTDLEWWFVDENQGGIIARQQPASLFINRGGDVAIRQEPRTFEDDDVVICFRPEHVPALIKRLQALIP